MPNSLKIYKTQLTPARNALLDNIEYYLTCCENRPSYYTGEDCLVYSNSNFQYVKPELDTIIKVDVPLGNNRMYDSIGNYVRIQQRQGIDAEVGPWSIWYYFIISSRWTAQRTLELTLSMDTVNTFAAELKNPNNWSDKTSLIRQHRDRFVQCPTGDYVKRIDRVGESIDVPYLLKKEDSVIEEPNSTGTPEWYLVYKTDNAAEGAGGGHDASQNPLKCYIYPKTSILYQQSAGSSAVNFTRNPAQFNDGKIYGITSGSVSFSNINVTYNYAAYNCNISVGAGRNSDVFYGRTATVSGHVGVGDRLFDGQRWWTCESVVWYEQASITGNAGRMTLPLGVFTAPGVSHKAMCVYLSTVGDVTTNFWFVLARNAQFTATGWQGILRLGRVNDPDSWGDRGGWDHLIKDTSNTTDNWFTGAYDTNWARNPLWCDTGSFSFTSAVDFIYAVNYSKATPSKVELTSGDKFYTNGTAGTSAALSSIDFLDKTDATLVKILALPYCPTEIQISSGSIESGDFTISFDNTKIDLEAETATGYETYKRLYYRNTDSSFGKALNPLSVDYSVNDDFLNYYYNGVVRAKSINNEPKLLNSSFHKDLLVYDNVSKSIRLEDLEAYGPSVTLNTYFQPTNTLASTMMFSFSPENGAYSEIVDWDRVLVSTRNNELPIYNNEYLNYMRYGYNAEKQNMEATAQAQRQAYTTNAVLSIGGGAFGGAVSGAVAGAKYMGVGAIPGAIIGAVVGTASAIAKSVSAINSAETAIANAQRSLESKVDELQHTAATVQGGYSSVDLMTTYTGNRLHHMTYDMTELMKEAVYDKLYYCGYNYPVQAKPALNTRLLFDFIQCDPVFENEATSIYAHYIADIKDRFNTGVTYYHNISSKLPSLDTTELVYDWKQQFENWEHLERVLPLQFFVKPGLTSIYNRRIDYSVDYTDSYTQQFIPASNNTYRYSLTYINEEGEELMYPYNDQTDYENGYTLSTTFDAFFDFNAEGLNLPNGTKILVRLIDIDEDWRESAPRTLTVNRTITLSDGSVRKMGSKLGNYYAWDAVDSSQFAIPYYTQSYEPQLTDKVYTWQIPGGMTETALTITNITSYLTED